MANKAAKGGVFESEMCKKLSLWWTDGTRDDVFWRTGLSGGRATARAKRGLSTAHQHGDIGPTDPIGAPLTDLFVFELKRGYSDATVQDLLDRLHTSKPGWFEQWVVKAREDCEAAGALGWLLITRRDRRKEMIWMERKTAEVLDDVVGGGTKWLSTVVPWVELVVNVRGKPDTMVWVCGTLLSNFVDRVKRDDILELAQIA